MYKAVVVLGFLVLSGVAAPAQESSSETFKILRFHRVYLHNGNWIDGDLVVLDGKEATLKILGGELSIRRSQIDRIEYIKMRSYIERAPIIGEKPAAVKPSGPPELHESVKVAPKEPMVPLATPAGVPEALRKNVDAILTTWAQGGGSDRQMARQFVDLGSDITPYLSLLLEQRTKSVPVAAISQALAQFADPRAIPGLLVAVREGPQSEDRKSALGGLIKVPSRESEEAILNSLSDPSPDVWKVTKEYLVGKFQKGEYANLPDDLSPRMAKAPDKTSYALTLGSIDSRVAHTELLNLLSSADEYDRRAAVQGLTVRPQAEDGPRIAPLLGDRDAMIQREVCLFVGKCKYAAAIPDLIEVLGSENQGLAANAHWALREISGERLAADQKLWKAWFDGSELKKNLSR